MGPAEIDGVGHVERPAVAGQELRVQSADEHGAIGGGLDPRHAAEALLHPRHGDQGTKDRAYPIISSSHHLITTRRP
ncbi:MAG TPA: hypothetical protein VGX76_07030, partial [Pirellulales bacterium]|nr:hypothetical protein [Pirellulales bacterium]